MPRKGAVPKREIVHDSMFQDKLVTQLISLILKRGKKSLAEKIVYDSFAEIKAKTNSEPIAVFQKAVDNVKPLLEVKSRRVGGATYQVPVEVSPRRGVTLALRWLISFPRSRSGKTMSERLAAEILEAASGTGSSIKKREDLHKMAEANRAFAHYRW